MNVSRGFLLTGLILLTLAGTAAAADPDLGAFGMPAVQCAVVQGDLVCATDSAGRFVVLDKSDPTNPQLLGETNLATGPRGMDWAGDLVAVCASWAGLLIVDVSDPASPTLVGTLDLGVATRDVAINGTVAYVAAYSSDLLVVDISAPATPTVAGATPIDGTIYAVEMGGGFLFTGGYHPWDGSIEGATILAMDVGTPASPVPVDSFHIDDMLPDIVISISDLAFADGVLFATRSVRYLSFTPDPDMYSKSLLALTVDGSGQLTQTEQYDYGLGTTSNYAALAATGGRLIVGRPWQTEIRDAVTLDLLDSFDIPCPAPVVRGQLLILPSGDEICFCDITGIGSSPVMPDATPVAAALYAPWPNPFNPRVSIAYELQRAGRASLQVFDPAGRRIAVLVDGDHSAGPHCAEWNGCDDAGHAAPAGTYLVRLETGERTVARKIQLLK